MTDLSTISTWRVLIVDDEPDNLKLASEFLSFSGAEVKSAASGAQVLEVVNEFKPSVILLDLSMPVMDGWEVYQRLREQPALNHIPIIALTAMAMPEDVARAKAVGFDGYIIKPFRVTSLLRDLMECVNLFANKHAPVSAEQSEPEPVSTNNIELQSSSKDGV